MTFRHTFDDPDRFVVGTLGEPGARVFYLQARQDGRIVSVVVEKEQVRAMADHFETTLDQLGSFGDDDAVPPAKGTASDLAPLELPLVEEFRVGTIGIGWDAGARRFLLGSTRSSTPTTRRIPSTCWPCDRRVGARSRSRCCWQAGP
jgi:uncharacterized repeat protein (TIGR03847 family)